MKKKTGDIRILILGIVIFCCCLFNGCNTDRGNFVPLPSATMSAPAVTQTPEDVSPVEGTFTPGPTPFVTPEPTPLVTPEPTPGPTPKPTPEPTATRVSFVGCGDNIMYLGNVRDAASLAQNGEKYDFTPFYERVGDIISGADIAFINQETLMAGSYDISAYPDFNSPQKLGYDLIEVGFDVISLANNHMLDLEGEGLMESLDFWAGLDVMTVGGYRNQQEYLDIPVMEKNGIRIAFLAYTTFTNHPYRGTGEYVIPYLQKEKVEADIARARQIADIVIVSAHWGDEYSQSINEDQKYMAGIMARAGADVIVGHHPHVLQPIEWIEGLEGRKTLCIYSLGNFIAEQNRPATLVGGMITFDIVKKGDQCYLENIGLIPVVNHFDCNFYNNQVYLLKDYTKELLAVHAIIGHYGKEATLDMFRNFVSNVIHEDFIYK